MNRLLLCRPAAMAAVVVVALALAAPLSRAQAPAGASAPAPTGNVENGKKIYTTYGCYQCHGREAHGGGPAGPRLNPMVMNYQAYLQYIRHPKGQMPPYTAKSATDQELADIYAYLKSLPKPPDPKSIPLLNE